jgi:hypothetical protein
MENKFLRKGTLKTMTISNNFDNMKKSLLKLLTIQFIFTGVFGCTKDSQSPQETYQTFTGCPEKPKVVLTANNVKQISLTNQVIKESGQASSNKSVAYIFEATAGQEFKYKTDDDICIWMYSPDNQVLNSTIIPKNGKYTVQIAALKGGTTFNLEMSLNNKHENNVSTNIVSSIPETSTSSPLNNEVSNQTHNQDEIIGWIWLGAVNNKIGVFSPGEQLIPSKRQPVTITPSVVPSPGAVVTIKTPTNIRVNIPQPPKFELPDRVSKSLRTGQKLKIIRVEAFVDNNSTSEYTRVWAAVGIP